MKTRINFLIIFFICCIMIKANGQLSVTDKTLAWYADYPVDKSDTRVEGEFVMIIKGQEAVELRRDQDSSLLFVIESIDGLPFNEMDDGEIKYHVHYRNGVRGIISIKRISGNAFVHIDFSKSDENALDLRFKVSEVTQLH